MVVILTREYKAIDANAFDEIEDKIKFGVETGYSPSNCAVN